MNIILPGGSGLIGNALATELTANGHTVCILSRNPDRISVPPGVFVRGWDGRTANGWEDLVEQADGLVNLVGENIGGGLWTAERKKRILSSRLSAGQAVVEAVRKSPRKPAWVLQASAVGIYGPVANGVCTESAPVGKDYLAGVARQWEESTRAVAEIGVNHITVRIGVVLDRNTGILSRFMLPFRFLVGGPLGSGRQWVSWIHIRDLVLALRYLIENKDSRGIYNLSAPGAVPNAEFGKELGRVMRRPYWLPVPGFALRLVLGEMSTLVLDGQRVEPSRLNAEGYRFLYPDLRFALENLFQSGPD